MQKRGNAVKERRGLGAVIRLLHIHTQVIPAAPWSRVAVAALAAAW